MELMLFRHGIAERRGGQVPDADRALTKKGRQRTKEAAAGLAVLWAPPARVLTSPKVRAFQTAEYAGQAFDRSPENWDLLADADAEKLQWALRQRDEASLMLVGHEPTFSELIELLCYQRIFGQTELKKAGCAVLDVPARNEPATLQALLPPRALRAVVGNSG
jgi:phosphohistidine phosphatase